MKAASFFLSHKLNKIEFLPIICMNFYTYFNTLSGINNLYFFTLIPFRV